MGGRKNRSSHNGNNLRTRHQSNFREEPTRIADGKTFPNGLCTQIAQYSLSVREVAQYDDSSTRVALLAFYTGGATNLIRDLLINRLFVDYGEQAMPIIINEARLHPYPNPYLYYLSESNDKRILQQALDITWPDNTSQQFFKENLEDCSITMPARSTAVADNTTPALLAKITNKLQVLVAR